MNNSYNDPYGNSEGFDQPPHGSPPPGYQPQGYPPPGYQPQGYPPPGYQQPAYPPSAGPHSGYGQYPPQHLPMRAYGPYVPARPQKSKIAAALLAFFLGVFGVHNFYLGHTSRAVTQLVLYLVGWVLSIILIGFVLIAAVSVWVFVEFILLLVGSRGYDRDADGYPLS